VKNLLGKSYAGSKRCSTCRKYKSLDEFYKDKLRPDGYVYVCKECKKIKLKIYRQDNRDKINQQSKESRRIKKQEYNDRKYQLGCQHCRTKEKLHWHHVDSRTKINNIPHMIESPNKYTKENIENEIKKCIVLCVSCHKKEHSQIELRGLNAMDEVKRLKKQLKEVRKKLRG